MTSSPLTHEYPLTIREHHLDSFGHVNNAVYLEILEEARWEMVTSKGYGLERVKQLLKGPIILEVNLRFKKELRLRDEVTITTTCTSYHKRIGKIEQLILNHGGEVCLKAEFVFGLFDLVTRKLLMPTDAFLEAVGFRIE